MKTRIQKKIAAITMARNDEFFLSRWIKYYGTELGTENLYIILDGTDQCPPANTDNTNIAQLEHNDMTRAGGDKYRIGVISDLAQKLFHDGYDIVIGCDTDEFLIVDPNKKMNLSEYLSTIKINTTVSGLGLDVGQNMRCENTLNYNQELLAQRKYALLSTRYTKPVVINRPVRWGSGFHHIKKHNFHIDPDLYLLHFGAVDMNMLRTKAVARGTDWINHLQRRGNGTINTITNNTAHGEHWLKWARLIQTICRPVYSLGKPCMFGLKIVVKIPARFIKSGI